MNFSAARDRALGARILLILQSHAYSSYECVILALLHNWFLMNLAISTSIVAICCFVFDITDSVRMIYLVIEPFLQFKEVRQHHVLLRRYQRPQWTTHGWEKSLRLVFKMIDAGLVEDLSAIFSNNFFLVLRNLENEEGCQSLLTLKKKNNYHKIVNKN
jgi:hypothetical protein